MLYIPQYWWHVVRSYEAPNIAVNVWFGLFNYEDKFREAGISEDTNVVEVLKFTQITTRMYLFDIIITLSGIVAHFAG